MLFWSDEQKDNRNIIKNNRRSAQSGNVLALLFGAVALTGALAATSMEVVVGPIQTITRVTQKNMADTQMMTNSKLVVMEAATHTDNRDTDSDGFVEPIEYIPNGASGCSITFTGGGCLPTSMGAALTDPYGRPYAYCVWDHGTTDNGHTDASPSSPYRLQGTTDQSHPVIAMISAGRDQVFQTSCGAFDGSGDEGVVKPTGSDDWIFTYTYAEATAASAGLWQLKSGDPDTAEIDKDLEIKNASNAVTASINRSTGVGDFLGITTDLITAKTSGTLTADVSTLTLEGTLHVGSDGSGADGAIELISDVDEYSYIDFKGAGNEASDYRGRIIHQDGVAFRLYVNGNPGYAPSLSILNDGDVGIGAVITPHASAALDVTSTNKGFLPPRMNTSQRDGISSPATGLLIYNTLEQALQIFDGTNWIDVGTTLWELAGSSDAVYSAGSAGVGASTVDASAVFELSSTTKGFLPPRMDESQRDGISSPPEGLIIYNTDSQMPEYFDGSDWVCMAGSTSSSGLPTGTYSFTSHRFTNCGQTGRDGPSLSQCRSAYSTSWDSNNSYFNMSTNGIQIWTVPATGTYRITAAGAAGGGTSYCSGSTSNNGGAVMTGEFSLNQGEQIRILVGQRGENTTNASYASGGGGGTFVVRGTSGTSNPLIIAGGGAGFGSQNQAGGNACNSTNSQGRTTTSSASGENSGNGANNTGSYPEYYSNGGGLNSDGYSAQGTSTYGGRSFSNGGRGGESTCYNIYGGFGGGSSPWCHNGGGAGGYSGGQGGSAWRWGNGAGSYNSGTNPTSTQGGNVAADGYVDIQLLPSTSSNACAGGSTSTLGQSSSDPANNCLAIKQANSSASDGVYWINAGGSTYQAYCDMTTDGGGWTLVYKNNNGTGLSYNNTSEQGSPSSCLLNTSAGCNSKHSDSRINAIKSTTGTAIGYRVSSPNISNRYFFEASCVYQHSTMSSNNGCRRYTASYTSSTSPSYTQCNNWGGNSGGLDAWYQCNGGGYTNVANTHKGYSANSGITTNSSGGSLGSSSTGYSNTVLMWVK